MRKSYQGSKNSAKKHKTLQTRVELKKYKVKAQLVIKQSKKKSWQEYVSRINSSTQISQVWTKNRKMNGFSSKITIRGIKHNGWYYSSPSDIANIPGQTNQDIHQLQSSHVIFLIIRHKSNKPPSVLKIYSTTQ